MTDYDKNREAIELRNARISELYRERSHWQEQTLAAEARIASLEALVRELADRLGQWESATNHATTHLSPSGVVVKRENKAFLLNNILLSELTGEKGGGE